MRYVILIVTALAAAGCTAPGEPPAHPSQGQYADLMRRETDKTESALATMQRVFAWVANDKITSNYATVTGHQSIADLAAVATDLHQVTAPTAKQRQTQADLQALASREAALIDKTLHHLDDTSAVTRARSSMLPSSSPRCARRAAAAYSSSVLNGPSCWPGSMPPQTSTT